MKNKKYSKTKEKMKNKNPATITLIRKPTQIKGDAVIRELAHTHPKMKRYKNVDDDTFMYHMLQKCGYIKTLEVFFREPTNLHFIRSISNKIKLAQTSVRSHINFLLKENFIVSKEGSPFDGYVSNRDNENFIYYKRIYNLSSLKELKDFLVENIYPQAIVVFGSYNLGEDIESSDIDLVVLSKSKKNLNLGNFERNLLRKINVIFVDKLNKLDDKIQKKVQNGVVLYGSI